MSRIPFVQVDTPLAGRRAGEVVVLSPAERHHLRRVLRLPTGAMVEVADGAGSSAAAELTGDAAALTADAVTSPPARPAIEVAQALAKQGKVDEVVRAVTELGADALVPVLAARSVARPDHDRAVRAVERWDAVARSACEQSRRTRRPRIDPIRRPFELAEDGVVLVVLDPTGAPLPDHLDDLRDGSTVRIAVGPEGGWTPDELTDLAARGARLAALGPTVLRTEHAATSALAVLAAGLGRWQPG